MENSVSALTEAALGFTIGTVLTRQELCRLASKAGLEYPGIRTSSVSSDVLAADLAAGFLEDRKIRELSRKTLDKTCRHQLEQVRSMSEEEAAEAAKASAQHSDAECARLLWALASDTRESVKCLAMTLFDGRDDVNGNTEDKSAAGLDRQSGRGSAPQADGSASDEMARKVDALHRELDKISRALARQKRKTQQEIQTKKKLQRKLATQSRSIHELQQRLGKQRPPATDNSGSTAHKLEDAQKRIAELEVTVAELTEALREAEQQALQARARAVELEEQVRWATAKKEEAVALVAEALARIRKEAKEARQRLIAPTQNVPDLFSTRADERVGIFVDVQNIYYAARDQYGGKIDYQKLLDLVVDGRRVVEAYAYVVHSPEVDQTPFTDMLTRKGFIVRTKNLITRVDGTTKGDWDIGIVLDILESVDELDTVILVSGDGDFVDLVNMLRSRDVKVEVAAFPASTSVALSSVADVFHPLGPTFMLENRNG